MKQLIMGLLFIVLAASLVFAAGEGGSGGTQTGPDAADGGSLGVGSETAGPDVTNKPEDAGNPEDTGQGAQVVLANQGEELQNAAQEGAGQGAQIREQVQARVEERKQELEAELAGKSEKEQNVLRNQNAVRLAVHALLEMKDGIGGIGQNVSAIARDFNNSIQSTIRAETRVEERSGFTRFFAGGDEAAAEEIEKEVAANRARIAELAQLRETCPCDETTRALFQEQITTMAQEQERLGELVAKEKKSKGLLGWMWK